VLLELYDPSSLGAMRLSSIPNLCHMVQGTCTPHMQCEKTTEFRLFYTILERPLIRAIEKLRFYSVEWQ